MFHKNIVYTFMLFACNSSSPETSPKHEPVITTSQHPQKILQENTEKKTSTKSIVKTENSKGFPTHGIVITKILSQEECEQKFPSCSSFEPGNFFPSFQSEILDILEERQQLMKGKTWNEGCPIGFEDLAVVRLLHWNETGGVQWGEIVVAKEEAVNMVDIFQYLYDKKFPMTSVKPMYHFDGNDDLSMKANNTSAFNCRKVKNSNRFSEHSYGKAIDVNPLWNPWVSKKGRVDPPSATDFVDRNLDKKGLLKTDDDVVRQFQKYGWKWGGYWNSSKDYQHFSVSGR